MGQSAKRGVAIFCHADVSIGLGHLRRCSLVQQALYGITGVNAELKVFGEKKELPWLKGHVEWLSPDEDNLNNSFQGAMSKQLWILDFNPEKIQITLLKKLCGKFKSQKGKTLIALDKLSALLDIVDLLFVPCFYSGLQSKKVSFGWQNYILPDFPASVKARQVLVLTGGSDFLGLRNILPELLETCIPGDFQIKWVVGPYSEWPEIPFVSGRWQCLENPENLQGLFACSQIVMTCYGVSFFEALKAGATTVLLEPQKIVSNEELAELERQKVCIMIRDLNRLPEVLLELFQNLTLISKRLFEKTEKLLANAHGEKCLAEYVKNQIRASKAD